ncbi:MAG: hypothetical protein H0T47_08810 [Planctomycetaceae bacterium]|nr:hypothetical protein [Planctomycetaceae bacterium]
MDWVILIFLAIGFLFFWGVWIFGYWLPMARESQRQFKEEQARERAAAERLRSSSQPPSTDHATTKDV